MSHLPAAALDSLLERSPFIWDGWQSNRVQADQAGSETRKPLSEEYEIRGIISVGGQRKVSVWNKSENKAVWVPVGEELYPGFPVFADHDSENRAFWVKDGDRQEQLSLAEADYSRTRIAAGGVPTFVSNAQSGSERASANTLRNTSPNVPGISPRAVARNNRSARAESRNLGSVTGTSRRQIALAPPSFVGGGGTVARVPQNPNGSGTSPGSDSSTGGLPVNDSGTEQTDSENESPVVQRPAGAPPDIPITAPPQSVPQLPPGFNLEQYLRERANGG